MSIKEISTFSDSPSITQHDHQQHGRTTDHNYHRSDNGDGRQRGGFWISAYKHKGSKVSGAYMLCVCVKISQIALLFKTKATECFTIKEPTWANKGTRCVEALQVLWAERSLFFTFINICNKRSKTPEINEACILYLITSVIAHLSVKSWYEE